MHNQKLLAEFVEELQEILRDNPGINCIIDNTEYGSNEPHIEVKLVYIDEHNHHVIFDDWQIENVKNIVKDYTKKTAEQMWQEVQNHGYEDFEHFKEDYDIVKNGNLKELEMIKKAVLTVVIKS